MMEGGRMERYNCTERESEARKTKEEVRKILTEHGIREK